MAASSKTSTSNRNHQIAVSAYLTSMKAPETLKNGKETKKEALMKMVKKKSL